MRIVFLDCSLSRFIVVIDKRPALIDKVKWVVILQPWFQFFQNIHNIINGTGIKEQFESLRLLDAK